MAQQTHERPQRVVGYRATSRFFRGLSGFVPPNRRLSPKSAKSPGLGLSAKPTTRWGDGFKRWPTGQHDAGTTSPLVRRDEFAERILRLPENAPPHMAADTMTRVARRLRRLDDRHATIKAFGFRIQPPLPHRLATNSVCRWFRTAGQPVIGKMRISKHRRISLQAGNPRRGREWRLSPQS